MTGTVRTPAPPGPHGEDIEGSTMLERLLLERYSCRAFAPDPVPDTVIERLLALAQRTASWCNVQPWQVFVTRGAGTERLREALFQAALHREPSSDIPAPAEYRGEYLQRRRDTGFGMYGALGIERADKEGRRRQELENFRLFGAPHVAVITSDAHLGPYGLVDVGGYVATLLLAAQSLGLAAVPQAAIAMQGDAVREHFEIGPDRLVVCGVSFGYADGEHPVNRFRTTRAELDRVVTWVDA